MVALIMAGLAIGAGGRARRRRDLGRPLLVLGFSAVLAAISAAAAGGGWALPIVASLAVLGYVWGVLSPRESVEIDGSAASSSDGEPP